MASLKRDVEMERVANELREKRGTESLMDRHSKKIKKVNSFIWFGFQKNQSYLNFSSFD